MNQTLASSFLPLAALLAVASLTGCDKKASPAPTAPTANSETAPVPALAMPPGTDAETAVASEVPLTDEAALAAFKAEIKGIKVFMEANQGNTDAGAALGNLREFIKRSAAVSVAGLPEDLSTAYTGMVTVMQSVQATLDDLPVPVDQLQKYTDDEKAKGTAEGEAVMAKRAAFEASMIRLQEDGKIASDKLKEVGAKYGIEALELSGS